MIRSCCFFAVAVVAAGCAQGGGSSPGTGTGTGFDGSIRTDGGSPRPDAPITLRPDTSTPRPDAGTGCPEICMLPNASSSCVADRCVIDRCDAGFDDCDGDEANGCETSLDSPDHCGACGNRCDIPNATAMCGAGSCDLGTCDPGFGDCDGMASNGCEASLDSAMHCGACGNACPSGSSCTGGSCGAVTCPAGRSNCDGDETNGCELDHTAYSNTCSGAEELGSAGGDLACGFLCSGTSFSTWVTRQGKTGRWFHARVSECSNCPADVYHCFRLEVPAGTDYDLIAYSACGTTLGSLPAGVGATEELCVYQADDFSGADSGFDYWLEVRHRSGQSCFDWRLTIESTSCTCG